MMKSSIAWAYQRFVNTTPKPRATKKSSGEFPLVLFDGLLPPGLAGLPLTDVSAGGAGVVVLEDVGAGPEGGDDERVSAAWRTTMRTPSRTAALIRAMVAGLPKQAGTKKMRSDRRKTTGERLEEMGIVLGRHR